MIRLGSISIADAYAEQQKQQRQLYNQALRRYRQRMGTLTSEFGKGIESLKASAGYYQPGGEFITSQYGQIEQGTRQGLAQAMSNLSRTGMWSGSTAAGIRTSAMQQEGLAKAALEAERIYNLTNINAAIAQMRAGLGQSIADTREPSYGEYYSAGFGPYLAAKSQQSATQFSALARLAAQRSQQRYKERMFKMQQGIR